MDIKKFLWITSLLVTFLAVFFLISVIAFLTMPPAPTGPPAEVTITTGEAVNHNLNISANVTLEGEKDSYTLIMTGPEGAEVSRKLVTEAQMADGKELVWMELVWMELVEEPRSRVSAKPGAYSLVVTDSFRNKVYEKSLGPYSGANLSIGHKTIHPSYSAYREFNIDKIVLKVKNDGDLPAYISRVDIELQHHIFGVDVEIGARKDSSRIPKEEEVILPGETATITASEFTALRPFPSGDYKIIIKLKEGSLGQGKTVATCSAALPLYVPWY